MDGITIFLLVFLVFVIIGIIVRKIGEFSEEVHNEKVARNDNFGISVSSLENGKITEIYFNPVHLSNYFNDPFKYTNQSLGVSEIYVGNKEFIHKGENIIKICRSAQTFSSSPEYGYHLGAKEYKYQLIESPIDGYVFIKNRSIEHKYSSDLIAVIYQDYETLINKEYATNYTIVRDVITNKRTIKWNLVNGDSYSYCRLGCLNFKLDFLDEHPCIYMRYGCHIYARRKAELIIQFENNSTISLPFNNKKSNNYNDGAGYDFLLYQEICEELFNKEISTVRIEYIDNDVIDTGSVSKEENEIWKRYCEVFKKALKECEICIPSQEELEKEKKASRKRSDTCYVYLMQDTANGYHKIGISNNPHYREHTLQSEKPSIELVYAKIFPTRSQALELESSLHNRYEDKHIRGEWFSLQQEDIEDIKRILKDVN